MAASVKPFKEVFPAIADASFAEREEGRPATDYAPALEGSWRAGQDARGFGVAGAGVCPQREIARRSAGGSEDEPDELQ